MTSYRLSHAAPGYGGVYAKTYRTGYYRAQWEDIERPLLQDALGACAAAGARSLLDFACGTGRVTAVAEAVFPRVVGVDVSAAMLDEARAACRRAELLRHDLTVAPLGERFDVATAFRFFLNAEPALRAEALAAIRRTLVPGGTLLANVHVNAASPLGLAYRLRNRLAGRVTANVLGVDELTGLVEAAGFRVASVTWYSLWPRTGWLFPPGSRALMRAAEWVERRLPAPLARVGQSFLLRAVATNS